jgi:TonB-linked SusC/RagA family outer membrane protein
MRQRKKSLCCYQTLKVNLLSLFLLLFTSMSLFAQQGTVKGLIVDEKGIPFGGVTVLEEGTKNGVISDTNGNFSILLKSTKDPVLKFSCIGYKTITMSAKGKKSLTVQMQEEVTTLGEVVAIGYGSVKKRDLTGSVASIKGDELMKTNPVSINQALQGKIAGVQVMQADGAPGAGISIQIRGANSFTTSTEPLYVVDGVPFNTGTGPSTDYATKQTNNPLSFLNPRDVESIEVLKDASATAIYGSRGANGVVLITTKRGKVGEKTKIEFNANYSVTNAVKKMKVLDAGTYAEFRNEESRNKYTYDGGEFTPESLLPYPIPGRWTFKTVTDPATGQIVARTDSTYNGSPDDYRTGYFANGKEWCYNTNWQDKIFHTAFTQDYNLGLSGGDQKGSYTFSIGALDQQGIIVNSFYKRYNIRSNIERKVTKWFSFGNFLTASKSKNRMTRTNSETFGIINDAISFTPTKGIYDPDHPSGFSEDYGAGRSNPYLYVKTAKNILESIDFYNSTYAQVNFFDFLNLKESVGYGYSQSKRDQYYNRYIQGGVTPTNGYASQSDSWYQSISSETTLSFNKNFGVHHFDAVVGMTYEKVDWGGKSMSGSGFANDINEEYNMSAAKKFDTPSSSRGRSSLVSYLARVNYILMDKYLFTASWRRDGSSRLAFHRWSDFYSGAVAWRISEENFIKKLNFFDNLKLRLGYGETGNQGINAYATRSQMVAYPYTYNGVLASGYAEDRWSGPAAPGLKWENTKQYNVGLDISIFDSRVGFVIDYYRKNTTGLLQYLYIPMSTGFSSVASNYSNIKNTGLEITGNFIPMKSKSFMWKVDANISFNKNKLCNLNADQFSDVCWGLESMFIRRNGKAMGTIYGYKEDGYYDNEAEVRADPQYKNAADNVIRSMIGQVKYKDTDKNGTIDSRDKVIIGDTNPDFIYGLTNTFTYKDFTLSFFLQGIQGNDIMNANLVSYDMSGTSNMPKFVWDNRWTEDNRQKAQFPRADITYTRSLKASDRFVENGSFLRMKNITMGYRFNNPIQGIDMLNVTFSVNNLFTITKYRWYDPDVNAFGSDPTRRGVDMDSYPSARTFNLGVQLSF